MAYPLGALCILTALREDPFLAPLADATLSQYTADTDDPEEAARKTAGGQYDLVGISLYLYNRQWFDRFVTVLRREAPMIRIFAGGPEAGTDPKKLIGSGVWFVVLGEGEETVVRAVSQLIEGAAPSGPGIYAGGDNPIRSVHPADLSRLASPLLTHHADVSAYPGILWEITRGCPFHCTFCFESKGSRSVRTYPFERIEAELDLLIARNVHRVFVLDPTFNMDRDRTMRILTLLRHRAPKSMSFTFEVRAELLDDATAKLFGEINCSLQIGLQSSNADVSRTIGRRFDSRLFTAKMDMLNRNGVVFGLDLIIGLPGDTLASFTQSLDYAIGCKPSNLDIFLLAVLPGTQLAEDANRFGLVYLPRSPYLLCENPAMDAHDIELAMRLKEACDRFYTRGNAAMWFHAACSGVGMRPSELLWAFSRYMEEHPVSDEDDIFVIQDRFVRDLYERSGRKDVLAALLSYMELHQGICHLQETGENPIVCLLYPSDELALLDTMELDQFCKTHRIFPEEQSCWMHMEDGILYVERIDP